MADSGGVSQSGSFNTVTDCKDRCTAVYKNSPLHMTTCYGFVYDSGRRSCQLVSEKNSSLVARPGAVTYRAKTTCYSGGKGQHDRGV